MPDVLLDCSRSEARERCARAVRQTEGLSKAKETDYQVVGKTGLSFPRVLWSWGEKVYVDIKEMESGQIGINVRGEKNVPVNIGANPEKFRRRVLDELSRSERQDKKMVGGMDMTRASELEGES
ncbi:hypothetical protein I7X12_04455 [Halosimplex litoreum]|uniref:Uncharacterized protein n=1 Tax=Halosimplex litoreum TaxID=1198301 RepID=A0A7T3G041_9EURY|nr:hypothetical protein [Halosimplex litoreum]QPV63888.1 hypothetical protein I7X12_04455 [Halosimplex litoreum]